MIQCEMIIAHHSDCECTLCRNYKDEACKGEACGTHEGSVRVCYTCGQGLELEGFFIWWDSPESVDNE